ncbi:8-oxo-dGTP diphosphatase MutT [Agaribacterium haliotis]|uniref:8-oxo-dGTP diphosphatase MutT n=1 Tax=Agaribacterium haliotis TaxID=2013869 RepID=UPI000BB577F9|nr:8-oxo-dGTP diphosphatase MutT [Agaribacterium haliotis]
MAKLSSIAVVVGVIENRDGEILISRRQAQQHLAGLWEFPGGKVDSGESKEQALVRELKEELDLELEPGAADFLFDIEHDYAEKRVCLHIFHVRQFSGEAKSMEGQPLSWVSRSEIADYEFPEANKRIVEWLVSRA